MTALILSLFAVLLPPAWGATVQGKDLFTGKMVEVKPDPKGMVVVFLSAKCPCSKSHVDLIKGLAKEFDSIPFVAVHSNSDEGKELSRDYFKAAALGFPVIQDSGGEIANRFRASKTPHAFLVSADGATVFRGGVSDSKDASKSARNYLREALEDFSKGKEIRTAEARTLGCSITRGGKSDW